MPLLPSVLALLSLLPTLSVTARPLIDVRTLFPKRQSHDTGALTIGSSEWAAQYPPPYSTPTTIPQVWLDALVTVEAAGLIPSPDECPVAVVQNGNPTYPATYDPSSKAICAGSVGCYSEQDIFDAPEGWMGISFDDGPLPDGARLNDFLHSKNISATHFYIGSNIIANTAVFQDALKISGLHFALHTWSHPQLTTLTNQQVVSEIGWNMRIIADMTGGRIPAWIRPPYGDIDERVRAIIKHVFGLQIVLWNHDSRDWELDQNVPYSTVSGILNDCIYGPKGPGLLVLEHELSSGSVDAFIEAYPKIVSQAWKIANIPDTFGHQPWYKNALNGNSPVQIGVNIASNSTYHDQPTQTTSSSAPSSSLTPSSVLGGEANRNAAQAQTTSSAAHRVGGFFGALILGVIVSFSLI